MACRTRIAAVKTAKTAPFVLFPVDQRMVSVKAIVVAVDAISETASRIVGITGNDGATPDDWSQTGSLTVLLRAESGGGRDGRTYTLTIEMSDRAGNTHITHATVTVPPRPRRGR